MPASYVKRLSTAYIWPARRGDTFVKNNFKLAPHTKTIHTRSSVYVITAKSVNNLLSRSTAAGMGIVGLRKSTLPLETMTCSRWSLCVRLHKLAQTEPQNADTGEGTQFFEHFSEIKTLMAKVVTAHRGDQDQKRMRSALDEQAENLGRRPAFQ